MPILSFKIFFSILNYEQNLDGWVNFGENGKTNKNDECDSNIHLAKSLIY
jgi:hypothetical protein